MAPTVAELFAQLVYHLKTHDWLSSSESACDQLMRFLSAIWTWTLCVLVSVIALLTASWQSASAEEVTKEHAWEWFTKLWQTLSEFLLRPDVRNALIVWFIVFWVCVSIPLLCGFGPAGIIAGSLAAWFQSTVYGAFTPAGGLFAAMTSVGMLGVACPQVVIPCAIIASLAAWIAWSTQV